MSIESVDEYRAAGIADSGTETEPLDIGGRRLTGIIFPASMTNTALKVLVSNTHNGTYVALQASEAADAGDYSIAVVSSKAVPITNLAITAGWRFIKLQGASPETGAKTLHLALRPV